MCQECFWLGRFSPPHSIDHQVKEYTSFTPSRHSFRRSLRCVPDRATLDRPRFPELPEKTLNLSHIVPPSPLPSHNGFEGGPPPHSASLESRSSSRSCVSSLPDWTQLDEEHRLIAHYAARLASQTSQSGSESVDSSPGFDTSNAQRDLIQNLEAKNRDIMREISSLRNRVYVCRQQQERAEGSGNPTLVAELRALRSHRHELESNLSYLQDSRKQLMQQLESLMKMLKHHQTSPTTPAGSPKSPPFSTSGSISSSVLTSLASGTQGSTGSSRSAPPTPTHTAQVSTLDSLSSLHVDGLQSTVSSVYSSADSSCSADNSPDDSIASHSLRNDLLVAADSVTNAMSSLVRELNSESSDDESQLARPLLERDYDFKGLYESPSWQSVQYGEAEPPRPHSRKPSRDLSQVSLKSNKWHSSDNHLDDLASKKDGDTPDWEEAGMGWVNR
ncbi:Dystrobrevin beta [Chionoecetes opilio]|uniref:Dystrobrevin beta n=1 Tax=Chionoecetes opilio TaxID=41210 RepID=A0A8J8WBJ9_CHIOP|nr:Dystrobrevin beta [Chionoecetes opilio]